MPMREKNKRKSRYVRTYSKYCAILYYTVSSTVVPPLRDHLQIQRNLVSKRKWSSKGGFIVCTASASVQGNSGL